MNISTYLITVIFNLKNLLNTNKYKNGQTFCLENWIQIKGSLSMFCIAPGAFIRRNTLFWPFFMCSDNVCICARSFNDK